MDHGAEGRGGAELPSAGRTGLFTLHCLIVWSQPRRALEHLECATETKELTFKLNVNSSMWLVAPRLDTQQLQGLTLLTEGPRLLSQSELATQTRGQKELPSLLRPEGGGLESSPRAGGTPRPGEGLGTYSSGRSPKDTC